jgi:TolB protein
MKPKTTMVAALAALLLAGCSSSTGSTTAHEAPGSPSAPTSTTAAQPAAHGAEDEIGAVPWSEVGPGWMLATWSPVSGTAPGVEPPPGEPTRDEASTTLYLVNPAGGRYAITTFPPPGKKAQPELVDWSGDGSLALFHMSSADPAVPSRAIVVDLHTGTQTTVSVNGSPRFTRPDGKALLVTGHPDGYTGPASLERIDVAGNQQLTYPMDKLGSEFNGGYLSTPDGARLVLGTATGLELMGNDGTAGKTVPVADQTDCTPLRWWDGELATTVLARCEGTGYTSRLWLVPINGDAPSALTAPNDGQKGPDMGDANAWRILSGTFVQALGGCGMVYLATLNADGTTTPVSVPKVDDGHSVVVVGVNGDHLNLQAKLACGSGESLVDYNPAANTSTVLLGPSVTGGGVIDAVPYPVTARA